MTPEADFPSGPADDPSRLEVFAKRGWLADQPAAFREKLLGLGRLREFPPERRLFAEEDLHDSFLGLAEGCWELTQRIGETGVLFHLATPGFWVGDTAVLGGEKVIHSLSTVAPSLVVVVPGSRLRMLLHEEPEWWPCMFAQRREKIAKVVQAVANQLTLSPKQLLARRILEIADAEGVAHATKSHFSVINGTARGTMQRALRDLSEAGAVESGYGKVRIRDRRLLERIAEDSGAGSVGQRPH
jgi:CRP-like cAMP-binding protein